VPVPLIGTCVVPAEALIVNHTTSAVAAASTKANRLKRLLIPSPRWSIETKEERRCGRSSGDERIYAPLQQRKSRVE
jgi:hypothetical protein